MKFDCGETPEARERRKRAEMLEWHKCFAWWPTRVGPRQCVWLETFERRFAGHCDMPGCTIGKWEYRA